MEPSAEPARSLRFATFEFDVRSRELREGARRIRLQEQPFEILRTMLERPGDVVTRDEFRRRLWPDGTFVDFEHSLNAAVKRLRAALGDAAANPRFVETLPRLGYRFIAKLDVAAEHSYTTAPVQGRPQVRLVVLPFANVSGDPAQEYFSDGLTEELIVRLGATCRGRIGVIARWSSMAFKGTLQRAREIGEALQASHLLEGTVRCDGDRVRITARRNSGPFVALNCAALPEQLLEAELFGYERGAYTGATQSKPGQLEQAAGGTLFLDEVGEMSPSAQAKFLRVLQEREFQRLGGTRVLRSDARVVAATNCDLQRAVVNGQFREDLYYRLNVFAIRLPPLRDRRDDILRLSEVFPGEMCRGLGRPPGGISRDARQLLVDYEWPGNVRELRNILERAAILCDGGLITAEHLAINIPPAPARLPSPAPLTTVPAPELASAAAHGGVPARPSSAGDLQSMERAMIEQALQSARFNKSKSCESARSDTPPAVRPDAEVRLRVAVPAPMRLRNVVERAHDRAITRSSRDGPCLRRIAATWCHERAFRSLASGSGSLQSHRRTRLL
jgi:TolB-like protein